MTPKRFTGQDLETKAGVLLEAGNFLALRKARGMTFALYELFGKYVEVAVKKRIVKQIEFLDDTDKLAMYVKRRCIYSLLRYI